MTLLYLMIYAALSSMGLALLRQSFNLLGKSHLPVLLTMPFFWVGGVLYGIGFLMWLYLLSKNDLSFIFPVAAGSLVISTILLGAIFLKEQVPPLRLLAVGFILIGIILANWKK